MINGCFQLLYIIEHPKPDAFEDDPKHSKVKHMFTTCMTRSVCITKVSCLPKFNPVYTKEKIRGKIFTECFVNIIN